jgi:hypothetical protein
LFGAGVFVLDGVTAGSGRVTGRERILNAVIDETSDNVEQGACVGGEMFLAKTLFSGDSYHSDLF